MSKRKPPREVNALFFVAYIVLLLTLTGLATALVYIADHI